MAPGGPAAPGPPSFSPTGAGGARAGLLDAIKGGATLRKAAPVAAAAPAGRSGLLADIKNRGFQLKKVEERKAEEKVGPAIVPTGAAASIAAVLARRSAIGGDDSSEDEADDWD